MRQMDGSPVDPSVEALNGAARVAELANDVIGLVHARVPDVHPAVGVGRIQAIRTEGRADVYADTDAVLDRHRVHGNPILAITTGVDRHARSPCRDPADLLEIVTEVAGEAVDGAVPAQHRSVRL